MFQCPARQGTWRQAPDVNQTDIKHDLGVVSDTAAHRSVGRQGTAGTKGPPTARLIGRIMQGCWSSNKADTSTTVRGTWASFSTPNVTVMAAKPSQQDLNASSIVLIGRHIRVVFHAGGLRKQISCSEVSEWLTPRKSYDQAWRTEERRSWAKE